MHSYDSVLTMAFTGVAAANLGTGSKTIDSVFHTNRADALEDLAGEQLDALVDELTPVKLLVIDEVSTCGAMATRRSGLLLQWRRHCVAEGGCEIKDLSCLCCSGSRRPLSCQFASLSSRTLQPLRFSHGLRPSTAQQHLLRTRIHYVYLSPRGE